MVEEERIKYVSLIIALLIVGITLFLMVGVYFRIFKFHILYEEFYYHHWFTWIGTAYIAFATPLYYLLKRRYPNRFKTFLYIHVFGNLLAFMLISIHFTQEASRSNIVLGTGIVLYAVIITLVSTGFLLRFSSSKKFWGKSIRYIHTAVTLSFYLIIIVHILHGVNII